jgi:hypothetical protein
MLGAAQHVTCALCVQLAEAGEVLMTEEDVAEIRRSVHANQKSSLGQPRRTVMPGVQSARGSATVILLSDDSVVMCMKNEFPLESPITFFLFCSQLHVWTIVVSACMRDIIVVICCIHRAGT